MRGRERAGVRIRSRGVIRQCLLERGRGGTAVSDGKSIAYDYNERLKRCSHGTGDVFASAFAGAVLRGLQPIDAAALAADVVCDSIRATPDDHWYGVAFERALPDLVRRLSGTRT